MRCARSLHTLGFLSSIVAGCAAGRARADPESVASVASVTSVARGSGSSRASEPPPSMRVRPADEPALRPRCIASAFSTEGPGGRDATPKNLQRAVYGMIAREPLRAVIATARPRIAQCWSEAMARDPALTEGRLTMRFVIVPDGTVACAEAVASSFADEPLAGCVAMALMELRFASFARGPITVSYPFALTTTP